MKGLYPITTHSQYIYNGIVGKDIRLTLRERLAILFHSGIQITLVSDSMWRDYVDKELEQKGR